MAYDTMSLADSISKYGFIRVYLWMQHLASGFHKLWNKLFRFFVSIYFQRQVFSYIWKKINYGTVSGLWMAYDTMRWEDSITKYGFNREHLWMQHWASGFHKLSNEIDSLSDGRFSKTSVFVCMRKTIQPLLIFKWHTIR